VKQTNNTIATTLVLVHKYLMGHERFWNNPVNNNTNLTKGLFKLTYLILSTNRSTHETVWENL